MLGIAELQARAKELVKESRVGIKYLDTIEGLEDFSFSATDKLLHNTKLPNTENNINQLQRIIASVKVKIEGNKKSEALSTNREFTMMSLMFIAFEAMNASWGIQGEPDDVDFKSNDGEYDEFSVMNGGFLAKPFEFSSVEITDDGYEENKKYAFIYGVVKEEVIYRYFSFLATDIGGCADYVDFNVYSDPYKLISYINALLNNDNVMINGEELSHIEHNKRYTDLINEIKITLFNIN